jgi:lipid-A-disaccharide synthase
MRIGMVAGESSGDRLGAGLIRELQREAPDLAVEGVAGPAMQASGCELIYPMERLAVMGLVEVLGRYRELVLARRRLVKHFQARPPDVFVGIDAPSFNLDLERRLHDSGIRTAHYVSPQVWAWREGRLAKIAQSTDLMLTLFPFEEQYYRDHGISVCFVGHPLADEIPLQVDKAAARASLDLPATETIVALLPGSRASEWRYHVETLVKTACWLRQRDANMRFVVAAVNAEAQDYFSRELMRLGLHLPIDIAVSRSREVISAADVVVTVSGTATLETLLLKRPMVVVYRMASLSYAVARALVRVPYIALPNILLGRSAVPELIQGKALPERIGQAVLGWLEQPEQIAALQEEFNAVHTQLRRNASARAAEAVMDLMRNG